MSPSIQIQAILGFIGLSILLLFSHCQKDQASLSSALSTKNAIVIDLDGQEEPLADSLLKSLFPALKTDVELLARNGKSDEQEWLVGLQYVHQQGWLPTFVGSRSGKKDLVAGGLDTSAEPYSTFRSVPLFKMPNGLFAATTRGVTIMGRLPLLVEDGIRELDGGKANLGQDIAFRRQWKKKAVAGRRLFIRADEIASSRWEGKGRAWLTSRLEAYEWIDVNLRTADDLLLIGGTVKPKHETIPQTMNRQLTTMTFPPFLPENISQFHWTNHSSDALADPYQPYFKDWWREEVSVFQIENQPDPMIAFKAVDIDRAEKDLDQLGNRRGIIAEEGYQIFSIKQLLDDQLLKPWWPGGIRNPFYTIIGDYAVFSASPAALTLCIDYYVAGQSVSPFSVVFGNLDTEATHFNWFRPDVLFEKKTGFTEIVWTEKPTDKLRQVSGLGQKKTITSPSLSLWWKYPLDGEIIVGPEAIYDASGRIYAFLTQDEYGSLYCLDTSGRLLWRKTLEDLIISDFEVLHTKDQSYIFCNAAQQVYALDYSGRFISPFPLKLATQASTGLTLIDFDQRGEASLFIPTTDGSVYGFDQNGELLPGWNPLRDTLPLRFPLVHLQENYRDFLFGINQADSVLIWSRVGEPALTGWQMDTICLSPPQLTDQYPGKVFVIDALGRGRKMGRNGVLTYVDFPLKTRENVQAFLADITGDGRKEYLFYDDRHLAVYTYQEQKSNLVFTYDFPHKGNEVFNVSIHSALIGILNKQHQKLFVVNGKGKLESGFPVAADRPAIWMARSEGTDQFLLVTGLTADVVAYGQ